MRKAMQAPKLRSMSTVATTPSVNSTSIDKNGEGENLELHGNPIYSPEDSLAKAASKLAHIKASSTPARTSSTAKERSDQVVETSTAAARQRECVTPAVREPQKAENHNEEREEIPLAARSLISKRNRRKSIFQRPARYGEWFDGDDDELERMVGSDNDEDEANSVENQKGTKKDRRADKNLNCTGRNRLTTDALASKSNNAQAQHRQSNQEKERARQPKDNPTPDNKAVDKSLKHPENEIPALSAKEVSKSSPPGTDVVHKVRAITEGLCDKLDGLIEESPAVGHLGRPKDDRSLRDKLLESWEGRSYYDRLMEIAAEDQKERKARMQSTSTETSRGKQINNDSEMSHTKESSEEKQQTMNQSFHGILSPPKARLRKEISAALAKAVNLDVHSNGNEKPNPGLPPLQKSRNTQKDLSAAIQKSLLMTDSTAADDATNIGSPVPARKDASSPAKTSVCSDEHPTIDTASAPVTTVDPSKLLKVSSCRGQKAMGAPWKKEQQQHVETDHNDEEGKLHKNEKKDQHHSTRDVEKATEISCIGEDVEALKLEMEALQSALQAAEAHRHELEDAREKQQEEIKQLKEKLAEALETAEAEAEAHKATEKRMASLEAEITSLKVGGASGALPDVTAKSLKK